jgi:hypothetical protein
VTWIGLIVNGPRVAFPRHHLVQDGVIQQFVLVELVLNVGQGKFGAPDGNIDLRQYPWQRADVILMGVGEEDAAHLVAVLKQVCDIGHDDVYAEQFRLGEHQAGVDNNNVIAPADRHAVHAELAESAKRNKL